MMNFESFASTVPLEQRTREIMGIRREAWLTQVSVRASETGETPGMVALDLVNSQPFDFLSNAHGRHNSRLPKFTSEDADYTKWWTLIQHRVLLRGVLMGLHTRYPSEETQSFKRHGEAALKRLLESLPSELPEFASHSDPEAVWASLSG